MKRFASPLSLFVAAILGGLVSQGISRWIPEAQAQDERDSKEFKVVRAEKFELMDSRGRNRLVLGMPADGSVGLILANKEGKRKIWLGLSKDDDPAFGFFDGEQPRMAIGAGKDGLAGLTLVGGPNNQTMVEVGVRPDGSGSTTFYQKSQELGTIGVGARGIAGIVFSDSKGRLLWKAP